MVGSVRCERDERCFELGDGYRSQEALS
jgi:hypothetical protein